MTRRRKTRKPGALGTKSQPKNMREHNDGSSNKGAQRTKGKAAGSRHNVGEKATQSQSQQQNQDPRLGSKRKISLAAPEKGPEKQTTATVTASNTKEYPAVEVDIRQAEDEFAMLENDERLQDLLAMMDEGKALDGEDQVWVEQQLDRYRQLANELGIDLDEDDEEELEPWKRFENPKDWI